MRRAERRCRGFDLIFFARGIVTVFFWIVTEKKRNGGLLFHALSIIIKLSPLFVGEKIYRRVL